MLERGAPINAEVHTVASLIRMTYNFQNNNGETALHFAVLWGEAQIVKFLLENEANPDLENR